MTTGYSQLFSLVRSHTPSAQRVAESEYRLEASYFSDKAEDARVSLSSSSLPVSALRELADVSALSDFSLMRIPASESRGVPFLTVSESLEWIPKASMFLSRKYEPNLDDYIVKEGSILLSRSGTVGNALIVGKELVGKAVANHAIRITPRAADLGALVYLILSGEVGRQVVTSYAYGAVVSEIRPAQIEQMKVPIPAVAVRAALRDLVERSLAARSEAFRLHQQASVDIQQTNGLQDLVGVEPFAGPQAFLTPAKVIPPEPGLSGEWRLDAHFHNEAARLAVTRIRACGKAVRRVADVSSRVLMGPRFKRNYVAAKHGVPFLSGKNIVQIRPGDLKYLSNLQVGEMPELILKQGWTLITCSGTIGRTCFVWKNYEDYTASQHILRVIPDESKIDAGYLYAFLSSRYGYEQILRYRHGSVIDEVTNKQIEQVLVACPSSEDQEAIGDKIRVAYEKRAEAVRLEDEAQAVLTKELAMTPSVEGA